jgi:hypothetical protein
MRPIRRVRRRAPHRSRGGPHGPHRRRGSTVIVQHSGGRAGGALRRARLEEARENVWLGEVAALEESLTHLRRRRRVEAEAEALTRSWSSVVVAFLTGARTNRARTSSDLRRAGDSGGYGAGAAYPGGGSGGWCGGGDSGGGGGDGGGLLLTDHDEPSVETLRPQGAHGRQSREGGPTTVTSRITPTPQLECSQEWSRMTPPARAYRRARTRRRRPVHPR